MTIPSKGIDIKMELQETNVIDVDRIKVEPDEAPGEVAIDDVRCEGIKVEDYSDYSEKRHEVVREVSEAVYRPEPTDYFQYLSQPNNFLQYQPPPINLLHYQSVKLNKGRVRKKSSKTANFNNPIPPDAWPCRDCFRIFKKKWGLDKHVCIKPGSILCCPKCGKTFKTNITLRRHLRYICGKEDDSSPCPKCGKFIKHKHKYELRKHVDFMCGNIDPKFQCHHCGLKYRWKNSILYHIKYTHLGFKKQPQPPFHCSTCDKVFKHKYNLNRHLSFVCGGKLKPKLQCYYCGYKNIRKATIIRHIQHVHLGIKRRGSPQQCPNCLKILKSKRNLDRHLSYVCGNEKKPKLQCYYCGHQSHYKHAIIYHINNYHMKPLLSAFHCPVCFVLFPKKSQLKRHLKHNLCFQPHQVDVPLGAYFYQEQSSFNFVL